MTRWLMAALGVTTVSGGLVFTACSGSSNVTLPDGPANVDSGTSNGGTGTGGGGPGTDASSGGTSGNVCQPCATAPPSPSCVGTGPCGCAPYACPDSGPPADDCTWSKDDKACGPGKYCLSATCAKGKCVDLGTVDTGAKSPVCGCDGVTYWNANVAAFRGMPVGRARECAATNAIPPVPCSEGQRCPGDASCNTEVKNLASCGPVPSEGTCWMLPKECPMGPLAQLRNAQSCLLPAQCTTECIAIRAGTPWYPSMCPF